MTNSTKDQNERALRVSRRRFAFAVAGATGTTACLAASQPVPEAPLISATVDTLDVDTPWFFDYSDSTKAFLIKTSAPLENGAGPDRNIVCYLAVCTHMGCPLVPNGFDKDRQFFECACHGSRFDPYRNGHQILGRATQHLVQVALNINEAGQITALAPRGLPVAAPLTTDKIERVVGG